MAMQWIGDVRRTAVIDEAEQVALRYLQAPFAEVRALYRVIDFDVKGFATELLERASKARHLRARAIDAQARYDRETREARDVVAEVGRWVEQLHLVVRFAKASGHPHADRLDHLVDQVAAGSWSRSVHSVEHALVALERAAPTLAPYGLQPGFVERGRELAGRLLSERADQVAAATEHVQYASRLQDELAHITRALERLAAARDLVMSITGEDLAGLEQNLERAVAEATARFEAADVAGLNGL